MKPDAILMAEMLVDKRERLGTPSPEMSARSKPAIADPRLSWQLAIKFIDLTRLHLESLSRIRKLSIDGDSPEHRTSAVELAARYLTSSTREVERAVEWLRSAHLRICDSQQVGGIHAAWVDLPVQKSYGNFLFQIARYERIVEGGSLKIFLLREAPVL
jgi:hypothetical protein